MRRELTDVWVRGLKPPASGRLEIWDARLAGLVLRITPAGAASWSLRTRTVDGKRTRPKLGTWPAIGVSEARKRALAALAEIQAGADLVQAKRTAVAERANRSALPTVESRLAEWQNTKNATWSFRHSSEVNRICAREIVPALGRRPLSETTRQDWTTLIAAKHRKAPGVGARLYRTAAAFLNHAEAHGWIAASVLPRKGAAIIAPPVAARARVLSDDELRSVWGASAALRLKPRIFVRLLILTAAREMEVADIAIGEIDRNAGRWTIPATRAKNRTEITLPLPAIALEELRAAWPEQETGPGWRLLGAVPGGGFRGFSKLKARLDELSGVRDWRWHDLRRSARTGMTRLGVPREHAEAALNHISGRSTLERTYNRHDFAEEIVGALGRWQSHVERLVSDQPSAEVVMLRRFA